MRVIAHRGASAERPENTLEAFELAIVQGADMVEFDVRLAAGEVPVVIHDGVVKLADGRRRRVALMAPEELRTLAVGGPCPTLEAVLDLLKGRLPFNLEIKELRAAVPAAHAVVAAGLEAAALLSSFEVAALEAVALVAPASDRALLARLAPANAEALLHRLGARWIHLDHDGFEAAQVERFRRHGVAVQVYTVDQPEAILRLAEQGVAGVFTNQPAVALRVLGRS